MTGASGRWRRWLLPFAVLACVANAGCAQTVGGDPAVAPVPVLTAAQTVRQALLNLAEAGVLHYQGTLVNPNNKTIGLDVSVTATGEAGGSISAAGQQGALVLVGGTLYVDAPAQFWSALAGDPGSRSAAVDSRWVRVPAVELGVDLGSVLRPDALGAALARKVADADTATLTSHPMTMVHGVKAFGVPVGDDTVNVAAADPHGVLHVNVPADVGTAKNVSLDVADVSTSEAGVYANIDQQSQQLQTVVDTGVAIQQGSQTWGSCAADACSVVVTFTDTGTAAAKVLVTGKWIGDGQPTGTCQAIVGPVTPNKATTATCTNTSPQWTSFFDQAHTTPGQHPYEVDWTAQALAAPPDLAALTAEAAAATTPAAQHTTLTTGSNVYVVRYQDPAGQPQVWKYGVTDNHAWHDYAAGELTACRSTSHTSCSVELITTAPNRPSADALTNTLVADTTTRTHGCPPGQWVDCAATPAH
jgi:hypothetical protein